MQFTPDHANHGVRPENMEMALHVEMVKARETRQCVVMATQLKMVKLLRLSITTE
jgi:hypothetical protein